MTTNLPVFLPLSVNNTKQAWCVDGRPDPNSDKGSQMLGASLHPIILKAIDQNLNFDEALVGKILPALTSAGFSLGVHYGAHKHEGKSDCGFADRMPEIITKAQQQQGEITNRLLGVFRDNQAVFQSQGLTEEVFSQSLASAYQKINAYAPDKIQLTGETLIAKAQELGARVENLEGDHQEQVAFVNLKERTTLDTNELNLQEKQAFNLDLWAVLEQTRALGIDQNFALATSLILYQATEMVLVEAKGNPTLPVIIHS